MGKVESLLDDSSKRENLAEKVLNTLSDNIRTLDKTCGDHALTMQARVEQFEALYSNQTKVISDMKADIQTALKDEFKGILQEELTNLRQNVQKYSASSQTQPVTEHVNLDSDFPDLHTSAQYGARPKYDNIMYSAGMGPPIQQHRFQPGPMLDNRIMSGLRHGGFPFMQSRPNTQQPRPDLTRPDPEKSLVVYNIDKNMNINNVIEQLKLVCKVYTEEIEAVKRLPTTGNRNSPIIISCSAPFVKWHFLKEINSLNSRMSEYKDVFAHTWKVKHSDRIGFLLES